MKRMATRVLLCIFIAASTMYGQGGETQREQMNRLLDGVHNRVNQAAVATESVLKVDGYLRAVERLAAAGQVAETRAQLERAAQVIAAANRLGIQEDFLLQDYTWKVRYALNTLSGTEEASAKDVSQRGLGTPDLLPVIQHTLIANALPPQLSAVVIVESGGDANALSPKGARGLWQLMPDTARRYGLRVDAEVDDRLDPLKSTHAAVHYLRDLYDMFHDWSLALAAYNAGENRIQSVMDRTGIRRFTEMADKRLLPSETIQYVPAVLKLMMR
jgi:soluble lytic murein transglycosylase-like protein